jgi:hypothetical protein
MNKNIDNNLSAIKLRNIVISTLMADGIKAKPQMSFGSNPYESYQMLEATANVNFDAIFKSLSKKFPLFSMCTPISGRFVNGSESYIDIFQTDKTESLTWIRCVGSKKAKIRTIPYYD